MPIVGTLCRVFPFAMHALESDKLHGCFGLVCRRFCHHHSQPNYDENKENSEGTWNCFISDKSSKMCCEKISNKISNKSSNKQQQLEEQWQASTRAAKRAVTRIPTRRYKSNSNSNKRSNKNKSITQATSQTFSWCLVAKWWPGCFQILCQNFKLFRRARPAVKSRGLWMLRMPMCVPSTTGFVGPW